MPYPAGGPTDVIARILAEQIGTRLGLTIIVDNVVGAGGTVAPARVARAAPDGATILIHNISFAAAPALFETLPYDTIASFEPVGLVNVAPLVLVGRKTLPVQTGPELMDWILKTGSRANLGHGGVGTPGHFCQALLARAAGIQPTFVAYRGAGPAMKDLISGQIDLMCDQATNFVPQVASGTIKAFAVTSSARVASLPEVPTTAEIGLPTVRYAVWHALFLPKGTPAAIVERLNGALRDSLDSPAIASRFDQLGAAVSPPAERTPAYLARTLERDIEELGQIARGVGMKAQ